MKQKQPLATRHRDPRTLAVAWPVLLLSALAIGVGTLEPAALQAVEPRVTALHGDREELLPSGPEERASVRTYTIPRRVWLDADGHPLPFQDPEAAEEFLRSASILSSEETPVGVTRPRKVLLEKDGVRAHAVVHQVDVDKKRVTLEGGSFHMHFVDSYRSQIAAYELSRLLGMQAVPPTVARGVGGKRASVQLWIEQVVDEAKRSKEDLELGPRGYLRHQAWDRAVFHNLVRNVDANRGNILWDRAGNIWLVDHTRTLAPDVRLTEPEMIERCSRQLYRALRDLDPGEVEKRLSPTLSRFAIRALLERRQKVLEILEGRIRSLGVDQVIFEYGTQESPVAAGSGNGTGPA